MRRASMFLGLGLLAATTATPTQCPQQADLQKQYAASCVTYVTQPGDSPYTLAKRFYGEGYQAYKIQKANEAYLMKEEWLFKPGSKIIIPPDDHGRAVDVNRPSNRKY